MDLGHILAATDGSAAAEAAVDFALDVAAAVNARLTIVHASPESAERLLAENPYERSGPEAIAEIDPVLGDAFERARARGVSADLEVIGERRAQEIGNVISGLAEGLEADLIVTGSRGLGAVTGALLGSVSQAILRSASIPVVVVHAPPGRADG